ncbi:MAG: Mo-dependent nitrogenase C-terminal domain-containing protein, partial [Microcystaceae cyanobacterium]
MDVTYNTLKHIVLCSWSKSQPHESQSQKQPLDLFGPLRQWLNNIEVNEPQLAHRLCHLIPSQCPFARKVKLFGYTLLTIPPLCKINPLYNELMELRFRAICYLVDECGEDI